MPNDNLYLFGFLKEQLNKYYENIDLI